ncbi:MAG: hypothetical protein AAFX50_04330, partial [Acidobacteriota bacterium]
MFERTQTRWIIALLSLAAAFLTPWSAFAQQLPGPTGGGGYQFISAPPVPGPSGTVPRRTLVIEGLAGINTAPISSALRQDLLADWNASGQQASATYFLNPDTVDAIERSRASGTLDPSLQPHSTPSSIAGCGDQVRSRTKNYPLDWNGTSIRRPVGSFTGELDVEADLDGEATAIFRYKIKRTGIFGVCLPYWVKYHSFQLKGSVSLDGSLSLSGSLSNSNNPWEWSKEIAKPHLGSTTFSIGPIFVRLGYNLPIRAGLKAGITVQADVDYETSGVSTGTFDYTCIGVTRCTGHASLNAQGFTNPQAVTGSIQGRAELEAYVDIGFRAYLYRESLGYAQVGVRPKALIDLWGYYGNNCGDADCDESAEALELAGDGDLPVDGGRQRGQHLGALVAVGVAAV